VRIIIRISCLNWKNEYREDSAEGIFVVLLRDVARRVWATGWMDFISLVVIPGCRQLSTLFTGGM
jgi:hypothetical protein